jgi:hypothetical protein
VGARGSVTVCPPYSIADLLDARENLVDVELDAPTEHAGIELAHGTVGNDAVRRIGRRAGGPDPQEVTPRRRVKVARIDHVEVDRARIVIIIVRPRLDIAEVDAMITRPRRHVDRGGTKLGIVRWRLGAMIANVDEAALHQHRHARLVGWLAWQARADVVLQGQRKPRVAQVNLGHEAPVEPVPIGALDFGGDDGVDVEVIRVYLLDGVDRLPWIRAQALQGFSRIGHFTAAAEGHHQYRKKESSHDPAAGNRCAVCNLLIICQVISPARTQTAPVAISQASHKEGRNVQYSARAEHAFSNTAGNRPV